MNSGIGGQAVMEGIMMRNKEKYAIAVRKPDQDIEIKVENVKNSELEKKMLKIPFVRGVFSFISSLVTGISCLMYSAKFYDDEEKEDFSKLTEEELKKKEEKDKKAEKLFMTGTLVLSVVMAVGIFMALPYFLMTLLEKAGVTQTWALSFFESIIRIVIFLVYIILISRMKDIQRVFSYHGAEHKCINCIENGLDLNVENVLKSSRRHKRCGTSFLLIVIVISVIAFLFIGLLGITSPLWRFLTRIILIPIIAGVAFEFLRLAGSSDNPVVCTLAKPGLTLQGLVTREPDAEMAEVAIAAVNAVFDWKAWQKEQGIRS